MIGARTITFWQRRSVRDPCLSGKAPLLVRYYLLRSARFSVFVHRLLRSDHGRDGHDHPWSFVSFLVSGGYWEHTARGRFWRRRWSVLYRPATWVHWIELDRPVWTIVVAFGRPRPWGFQTARGWVDYVEYRKGC